MDPEPSLIRQEIYETRQSLTEKLETLENQVRGTVLQARESVRDTIDTVKSTVSDTVDSVKRTFDIEYQVRERPFVCTGLAFVAGAVAGTLLTRPRRRYLTPDEPPNGAHSESGDFFLKQSRVPEQVQDWVPKSAASFPPEHQTKPSGFSSLFSEELNKIKGLALGAVMGIVRDMAKESLPKSFAPHIDDVINSATSKMGGQPLGQVLHAGQ